MRPSISEQAKQQVKEVLSAIEPGKRGAFIAITDLEGNTRLHLAARLSEGWKVALTGSREYTGALHGGVAVVGAW